MGETEEATGKGEDGERRGTTSLGRDEHLTPEVTRVKTSGPDP